MMSAWNLFWIVPMAASLGFFAAAVLQTAKDKGGDEP